MASNKETPKPEQQDEVQNTEVQTQDDAHAAEQEGENAGDALISLTIKLPQEPHTMSILVSPQEQVHEIRQSIIDLPAAFRHTCFHLEHQGNRINDFVVISEVPGLVEKPEVELIEDPYNEKEARIHVVRIRELIGAAGDRTDVVQGISSGLSLLDSVGTAAGAADSKEQAAAVTGHVFDSPASLHRLLSTTEAENAPKTTKTFGLSPWNAPPLHLKQRGHLLYLLINTNEGEQYHVTAHVSGFYVNKSTSAKFDPLPRAAPKGHSSHSLLGLLELISPSFRETFQALQEYNNRKDPLATFQISNAIPAAPWVVPEVAKIHSSHVPDLTRTQESYLIAGVDNADTLRDWNEEFQSAKELPKETVQDRVFRERLISKLFADYNDAATRAAILVARGEIPPLNPTECADAQIFVYNNIFFSFGADGVGTFASEGGDEAARVATGKDVAGVQHVNQADIDDLFTTATVVVDYLGKRIVGQSIVPGIFKPRDADENSIDYGAVEGKDTVAADERFAAPFGKLSKALKVKPHAVWDKEGKRFDLEGSIETKGLMGTDGRKYVLDLYRLTPLDISWLDEVSQNDDTPYPHRMTVLRPELVDSLNRKKLKEWLDAEMATRGKPKEGGKETESAGDDEAKKQSADVENEGPEADSKDTTSNIDVSQFSFALNPDAFSGQNPQTDEERAQLKSDEAEVRAACEYLTSKVIPDFIDDLIYSKISFPMDGQALSRLLHKRGINVRYLGKIAELSTEPILKCLKDICVQDMIARSFKHVASRYLRTLPTVLSSACISHLLNCLLGQEFNPQPVAATDANLKSLYHDADYTFEGVTPESLRTELSQETLRRFRYTLPEQWHTTLKSLQTLREIALKLGLQLQMKDYTFVKKPAAELAPEAAQTNGSNAASNGPATGESSKKKKKNKNRDASPAVAATRAPIRIPHTFEPEDIVNVVPVVKHSCPRSTLAEEALEAGRISISQHQKKLGQELLLESLSLHEQIYGILHPEVARVYNTLSMLYYQLEEKEVAVELARKAIVVAERTVGVDSAETLLNYLNLSLFLHQTGDSKSALGYAKHALELWKIIYGPDHPDSITTINNGAVMLQNLKAYHESRLWFEEALRVCQSVFGNESTNAATLLFQLAQAQALDQDSKVAVGSMRESYNIFLARLGSDDDNTKEAGRWLEQLTHNAVSIAKHAKDRQIQSKVKFPTKVTPAQVSSSTAPAPSIGQSPFDGSSPDSKSVDELIKYIEGNEQQKSSSKKKQSGRGNPKRRGGKA